MARLTSLAEPTRPTWGYPPAIGRAEATPRRSRRLAEKRRLRGSSDRGVSSVSVCGTGQRRRTERDNDNGLPVYTSYFPDVSEVKEKVELLF